MKHRRKRRISLTVLALSILPAAPARALTLNPPRSLAELAASAEAVVLVQAGASHSLRAGVLYSTRTEMLVIRSLSGAILPGAGITVQVPGGEVDGETWLVPGSPRFVEGTSYLLSLRSNREGLWRPVCLGYGVLRQETGAGGASLLVPLEEFGFSEPPARPDGDAVELIAACREDVLIEHLSRVLRGAEPWNGGSVLAAPEEVARGVGAGIPAGCTYFSQNGMNMRWTAFDSGGFAGIRADARGDSSLPDGGFRLVQESMDLWMAISGHSLNLVYEGPAEVTFDCSTGGGSRGGVIVFNDPCSEMDPGTLAIGGPTFGGTHTFDGVSWISVGGWIAVVNDGSGTLGDVGYRQMLAHELGHGLGFGHVSDTNALMFGTCCHNPNATDIRCVRYTYPPLDAANQRPVPNAGGNRTLVLAGDMAPLHGLVTDDGLPAGGTMTTTWRQLGGPAAVSIADASALDTAAAFPLSGSYLLGLSAHDGRLLRVSQATFDVDVFAGSTTRATFEQSTAGYSGTTDTTLSQNTPGAAAGSAASVGVDGDDPADSGLDTQVLLGFADIFGPAPGQVPPGVSIRSSRLELSTTNAGNGAELHRMLWSWTETGTWSAFGGNGIQSGIEALPAVEAVAGGADGLVRVDVTESVAAWSDAPCSNQGWAFLPMGDDGWDFSSSEGADPPRLVVDYVSVPRRDLVVIGDRWTYFKGTQAPPAAWNTPGFAAAGWLGGPTGIGYGDGDDATVLSDMRNRYATVYCRRLFTVEDPSSIGRLIFSADYDDGFVAYLNGVEAARSASMGAPGSPVNRSTLAESRDAGRVETFRLDPALLVAGENVLAVEVHNSSLDSSDLSFLPELVSEELLVADDAEWKFLRGSAPRPTDWHEVDFDDTGWESGLASIGFGDADDFTVIEDMQGAYMSIALRSAFDVSAPESFTGLRLTVIHDDGVVVYLNGTEVGRANMPGGVLTAETEASTSVEATATSFEIPATLLLEGRNVLAASIHNSDLTSSDLSFACVLVTEPGEAGSVACGSGFRRGDTQDDGSVDLSDALKILFHLFGGAGSLVCPDAADTDDDGTVELSDSIGLLNYIFRAGSPPLAPGPVCGNDPTEDELGECLATRCGG